jgi:hypothetical protein
MAQKPTVYPVLRKAAGTEIKLINGRYYLYERKSVYAR